MGKKKTYTITAIAYTTAGYDGRKEIATAEFDADYKTDGSEAVVTDGLNYLWEVMFDGRPEDKTLFPYCSTEEEDGVKYSGFMYSYPEPEIQTPAAIGEFKSWFQTVVANWGHSRGIEINRDKEDTFKYYDKINFKIKK